YCGGGAPANKLFENGDFATTETLYCRLTKQTLLEVVLADLERSLGLRAEAEA
ncbi:MAG: putative arylsulfatase regulatory protein, partial [Microvirga sp.]|nr:putative arylsulfatase regulatory protein [Microvirga sp.]